MKKINDKLYDKFSPQERVDLTIAAFLREDEAEIERLKQTCPRKTYKMIDLDYQDSIKQFLHHYLSFAMLFQSYYTQLMECEAYIVTGRALVFGYEAGFELASTEPNSLALEAQQKMYQEAFQKHEIRRQSLVADLKAVYQGYLFACEKLKLNLEAVSSYWMKNLSAFCPKLEAYLKEPNKPNQELLENIKVIYEQPFT